MTRRPDIDRSRAVLIGVSQYESDGQDPADNSEALPPLDSVSANLIDLKQLLTEPGLGTFAPQHCKLLENPHQPREIGSAVEAAAREAEDVLLVYYGGHGIVDSRGRLYLGLPGSSPSQASWTALLFETLREALLDSPARIRILILDCCFSGRAFESMSDDAALAALKIQGTYTLASSGANEPSFAPADERHTAFTGALLATARKSPGLTLDELFLRTRGHLAAQGRPDPRRRSIAVAGDLVIFGHPPEGVSAAAPAIEDPERTYEFDEARRVVSSVAPNPLAPGFWDVTIRNGSATPIAQLEVAVHSVDAAGGNTEDECVAAKGHPSFRKALDARGRAEVRSGMGALVPSSSDPLAQFGAAGMVENHLVGRVLAAATQQIQAHMLGSYPSTLPAGAEPTVTYFAPNASTVCVDLTFTDAAGNKWTRSDDQRPQPA
ncbi:caspase family protein [Rhodococcus qingshengii]|jgi:hypothetical protein|nr:hypothetical protein AWH04_04540 [Rhodococcus erythropolis]